MLSDCWTMAARPSWCVGWAAEAADPQGRRWPRTKSRDDTTAVYHVLDDGY
jgi:hypothetical protein